MSSHLAKLARGEDKTPQPRATAGSSTTHEVMKLASRQLLITVDEQRCTPGSAQVIAGGSVRIAVSSGPPQSFEIRNNTSSEAEETPRVSAGETYEW